MDKMLEREQAITLTKEMYDWVIKTKRLRMNWPKFKKIGQCIGNCPLCEYSTQVLESANIPIRVKDLICCVTHEMPSEYSRIFGIRCLFCPVFQTFGFGCSSNLLLLVTHDNNITLQQAAITIREKLNMLV